MSLRKAEIGPAQGAAALTLEVPALPAAATGTLPSAADGLKFGAAAAAPPPAIPPTLPGGAAPLPMALPPHAATEGVPAQPPAGPRSRPPANAAR